ncbi:unnamed protein product, partial [Enterobius vermicularis]|uniref:SprT-like domain-containing protein n=1 Tax=Enterobius vermicularis TaxID=51028 RepID=A0A0N4V429_ENTVE
PRFFFSFVVDDDESPEVSSESEDDEYEESSEFSSDEDSSDSSEFHRQEKKVVEKVPSRDSLLKTKYSKNLKEHNGLYLNSKLLYCFIFLTKLQEDTFFYLCYYGMSIEWNPRLLKTAGRCLCTKNFTAKIELSVKVCNRPDRVRDTLLHELCHAAVFVVDKIAFGRHGPAWQKWARQCMNLFPRLPVIQRCHQYSIDAKYHYICDTCGQTVKRHSKSLDLNRFKCGICKGSFVLHDARGERVEMKEKKANPFAKYVQANYKRLREDGRKHAEVMKILSENFKKVICIVTVNYGETVHFICDL